MREVYMVSASRKGGSMGGATSQTGSKSTLLSGRDADREEEGRLDAQGRSEVLRGQGVKDATA